MDESCPNNTFVSASERSFPRRSLFSRRSEWLWWWHPACRHQVIVSSNIGRQIEFAVIMEWMELTYSHTQKCQRKHRVQLAPPSFSPDTACLRVCALVSACAIILTQCVLTLDTGSELGVRARAAHNWERELRYAVHATAISHSLTTWIYMNANHHLH